MNDLLVTGHMIEIDPSKDEPALQYNYLPHHGVIKADSSTTKLRVVFNASSKTSSGLSLNDCQYVGPKIQVDAADLLLKTRTYKYLAKSDIGKMYRMVSVDPSQRCLQRILWRDPKDDKIKTYELTTLTFGQAASSFLATRCVKQLAIENQEKYPEASKILLENTYVDDVIFGAATVEHLQRLANELIQIFASANMELRKFSSNSSEFMESISSEKREFAENYLTAYKALGVLWSTKQDIYGFPDPKIQTDIKMTKRNALSQIASIYDPNGLIGPFTFRFKMFMKSVYNAKTSWDELLPIEMIDHWKELAIDVQYLQNMTFERYAFVEHPVSIQLHGFSDASNVGYGAAIYVRSENAQGEVKVHLLHSKSRGTDGITEIPRLELSSAVILVHTMAKVSKILNISEIYFWMDSLIALQWIKKEPAHLQPFVAHRVRDIQEFSGPESIWNHVDGINNPSDLISRGVSAEQLPNTMWSLGPSFLSQPQTEWPVTRIQFDLSDQRYTKELKKITSLAVSNVKALKTDNIFYDIIKNSSSTGRMKRKIAPVMRFIYNCRAKALNLPRRSQESKDIFQPTLGDREDAETAIARVDQMITLSQEFNRLRNGLAIPIRSPLIRYNPFWDTKSQLVRVGGRLANALIPVDHKFPIALSNSHLARIIAMETHRKHDHVGQRTTISFLNLKYWPLKAKSIVRQAIHSCHECFRAKPKLREQFMGNLPLSRVTPSLPFETTGVDYAGPILIKTSNLRKAPLIKAYIAVFVCLVTKAIHLEVVTSLSTESFKKAFVRFLSRRGLCKRMLSDNGSTFIGANNEYKQITDFLTREENNFREFFMKRGIDWQTIPPRAPHMGGLWEAAVKSAKHLLVTTMGDTTLTYEDLSTIMARIEAILNSRPLTYMNDDPNDPRPLTPGHFLIGKELIGPPEQDETNERIPPTKIFRRMTQIQQHFWNRWSREVLRQMQLRNKNFKTKITYQVGQIVLLHEDNSPSLHWPIGIIHEILPGHDGIVRVVKIRLANGKIFSRAITKIAVLPKPEAYDQDEMELDD